MNILVIDDQILFVEGLRSLLIGYDDSLRVEHVSHIDQTSIYLQNHKKPDLILLDINVNNDRYFRLFDFLSALKEQIPVLILSSNNLPSIAAIAMERGASGVISKNSECEVILDAIQTLLNGDLYSLKPNYKETEISERVTTRQQEVLYLLSQGLLNKQIASELNISANTVKAHLHDLFKHLKVSNRTAAVKSAQRYGLI